MWVEGGCQGSKGGKGGSSSSSSAASFPSVCPLFLQLLFIPPNVSTPDLLILPLTPPPQTRLQPSDG